MPKKGGKKQRINVIIRTLIVGDMFLWMSQGIIAPIFAIFLNNEIVGGSIATAGIASTIYLVTKALVQIPVSRITDKEKGNRLETLTMLGGYGFFILVPILFLLSTHIWHIYLIEILFGFAAALAYPGWVAIFTKFADKNREGFEWSLYSTGASLSMALAATAGGLIGELYGFQVLFTLMIIFALASFVFLAFFLSRYKTYLFNHN